MMLNSIKVLNNDERNSAIDFFRGIAIFAVVLFHFNHIVPLGYIGVDLFFVISGLLIGGILFKTISNKKKISFFSFFVSRGFKIWPSYYFFLIVGDLTAQYLYSKSHPSQVIPLNDIGRYFFFYQNYTGLPFHLSFDHIWSLCVEEHFYIILPVSLIIISYLKLPNYFYLFLIILLILTGILAKIIMLYYSNSHDTYSATHNRIDGLAWGVLLSWLLLNCPTWFQNKKKMVILAIVGLIGFCLTIITFINLNSIFYSKVLFHSFLPLFFTLILAGCYNLDFSRFKSLRFIAYYSYNWYLWHPLLIIFITDKFGISVISLIYYLVTSFFLAMVSTIFVEEPLLALRKRFLVKYFK
jgi:peptidoglycan/LPS O-acetylase OafA/YrhL